ncbi:hypothetical protein Pcac1_g10405 [Phytophthora cactorum]|uniref:ZSWIM1/3 RNaseH-like domain-containing protein n=2 Tax=Phytophthora cactorum TaxID=29920 RepID=A0A8T1B147_9STRA|nr:hypothetical protein Pcac1_g10405 [Phytophthora cactorum]KAG2884051.1 hypothetical protein PC115_g21434 [Phytophthora cactorum]KAG2892958.1 hypothetical protein PC117_g23902 [Phytophthora cactorum]KAG3055623.1 hypothetical protein PC122_g21670 [Phytophthora cactorum]KAG3128664.1 hypothetical protein C6341_g24452 [Phytophthora cactorum]
MRRETYTSLDDNVHVSELLRYFGDSPVNAVNTFRDQATKMTSCITFQIAHMRRMARKFPEALCMDATHGTSINSGSFAQQAPWSQRWTQSKNNKMTKSNINSSIVLQQ